jgi:hypothetical protein
MTESREKRVAEIEDGIRQILYRDWDTIGVCPHPRTSTTRTSGDVYRILASSGSEEALVRFLGARLLQIAKDIGLTVNDLLKNR